MDVGIVAVVVKAEFGGVALGEEILNVNVGDVDLLMARVESVQSAIGVFLEQVEPGGIPGDAVGVEIAEKADAGLFFGEEESAKVAGELLDSGANGNEIVVDAEVFESWLRRKLPEGRCACRSDWFLREDRC